VAQDALREVDARTPRLRLSVRGLRPGDVVTIDGAALAPAALDADLPVDPGAHRVGLLREGSGRTLETLLLAEGARRAFVLDAPPAAPLAPLAATRVALAPRAAPDAASASRAAPPRRGGLAPWGWIAVGATVLAVAAGAVVGTIALQPPVGVQGNLDPHHLVLQ
jgi:hypothetical protein